MFCFKYNNLGISRGWEWVLCNRPCLSVRPSVRLFVEGVHIMLYLFLKKFTEFCLNSYSLQWLSLGIEVISIISQKYRQSTLNGLQEKILTFTISEMLQMAIFELFNQHILIKHWMREKFKRQWPMRETIANAEACGRSNKNAWASRRMLETRQPCMIVVFNVRNYRNHF